MKLLNNKPIKIVIDFIKNDETVYHASSLSFFTIFAIIPTLLIFVSILSQVGNIEEIKNFLFSLLIPTHRATIENYIDTFFQNSAKMGYIGIFYIVATSMMFFLNYEIVINRIFNTKSRTTIKTIAVYSTITILSPFVLVLSIYLSSEVQKFLYFLDIKNIKTLSFLPFIIVWLLFFINYKISPNKLMLFKPVAIASFIAALAWNIAKEAFVQYIIYNKTYTTLYGSISTLIIFFLWIYLSWMIFIYGLEFTKFLEKIFEKDKI